MNKQPSAVNYWVRKRPFYFCLSVYCHGSELSAPITSHVVNSGIIEKKSELPHSSLRRSFALGSEFPHFRRHCKAALVRSLVTPRRTEQTNKQTTLRNKQRESKQI